MVAAFTKKNTLEQTGFKLTAEGFVHRGINYKFDEVTETGIYRSVFEHKYVAMGMSTFHHSVSILFVMKSGENVQITEQPTLLHDSTENKVEFIENAFNIISNRTFQNRSQKYVKQIEENGFFEYANWHFYPEQQKIIDVEKKRAYPIKTTKFLKQYGFISVVNQADGFGEKIIRKINGDRGISTIRDTDVFFALLKHFFNLAWN